jgi:acylglycerol lipase
LHGFAEHIARYQHFFDKLSSESGYAVTGYDQRGFGKTAEATNSQGVASFPQLLDDLDFFIQEEIKRMPGVPLFLYGHSTGGLLAAICRLSCFGMGLS